jgi:hypothetical protein
VKYFLTLIAMVLLVTPAIADHHEGGKDAAAMPAMGKPAELDALAYMHGEWAVDMSYMNEAGEWVATTGTATSTSVLNGCANRMDFEAEMMGMPFKGVDHTTFNRETGQYESVWMDDMSAKMSVMSGNFEGDALVMTGIDMWQGMKYHSKAVSKKVSDDEVSFVMSMSMDGGETWMENMKMTYKRK